MSVENFERMPIWYHPIYTEGIHPDARFPRERYARLVDEILKSPKSEFIEVLEPREASPKELLLAHDKEYVDQFLQGELDDKKIRRIGLTPWTPAIIPRTLRLMGGSVEAMSHVAKTRGFAANMAGGTHHAHRDFGSGYCIFNDLAVCAYLAIEKYNFQRVAILDLDVHQGDGTASIFEKDERVLTISVHCSKNFPFRKSKSDYDLEIIPDLGDKEYLKTVEEALQICTNFNPDLVLFQAGVDALETDALGLLKVTREGMKKRNEMVFDMVLKFKIPMVIFMGGGYSKPIEHTVDSFCDLFLKAAEVNQQILNP